MGRRRNGGCMRSHGDESWDKKACKWVSSQGFVRGSLFNQRPYPHVIGSCLLGWRIHFTQNLQMWSIYCHIITLGADVLSGPNDRLPWQRGKHVALSGEQADRAEERCELARICRFCCFDAPVLYTHHIFPYKCLSQIYLCNLLNHWSRHVNFHIEFYAVWCNGHITELRGLLVMV
jgi:hypothetical protein